MDNLKPCPFCGNLLEIVHKNGSKYVRCISGTCIFETARHGYHISDDELIKRCNRRPAEEALKKEVERLKSRWKEIEDFCEGEAYCAPLFSSAAYDNILNKIKELGEDTNVGTKKKRGEDE